MSGLTAGSHCPYCYRPLPVKEIMYRCVGRIGPTGKKCERKIDPVLSRQTGDNATQFPAFPDDGRKRHAVCPHCQGSTEQHICRYCHSTLPVHFGRADNRQIALVGAKESGKTVYMTVLLHELMHEVGRRLKASVLGADDHTRELFFYDYEQRLYERRELHEQTRTAAANPAGIRPLVFSLSLEVRRFHRRQLRRTLLSFFDTAGEDLISTESVAFNTRYLHSADGIILLLDPMQLKGTPGPSSLPTDSGSDPMAVLDRITAQLHTSPTAKKSGRINKPLAVVFSKMDTMDEALPPEFQVQRYSSSETTFDEADSLAVDAELRELLVGWHSSSMENLLDTNYRRYRFFGVSALGESPTRDENGSQRIAGDLLRPRRVHDPFLWLLNELRTL